MSVKVEKVIRCSEKKRGTGEDVTSPVRIVEEVYTLDGELIAENDPLGGFTTEDIGEFLISYYNDISLSTHIKNMDEFFVKDQAGRTVA
jgi:hypothetical protein